MLMAQEGIHDLGVHFGNVEQYLAVTENIAYRRGTGTDRPIQQQSVQLWREKR